MKDQTLVSAEPSARDSSPRWWHTGLAVLMILALAVAVGYGVWRLVTAFAELNPTVAAAVVATSGTIILSVASLLVQRT